MLRVWWLVLFFFVACAHGRGAETPEPLPPRPVIDARYEPGTIQALHPHALLQAFNQPGGKFSLDAPRAEYVDPGRALEVMWPGQAERVKYAYVRTAGETRTLEAFPMRAEAVKLVDEAGALYAEQKYAEAAKLAEQAVRKDEGNYAAWTFWGDCLLFAGDVQGALNRYDRAVELNPHDPYAHFFRGNALVKLKKLDPARHAFARALALDPRNPQFMARIANDASLDFGVRPELFRPRALARKDKDAIVVESDRLAHWMAYGMCKGVWLGDAAHREERTGSAEHVFRVTEELECLKTLANVYLVHRNVDVPDELQINWLGQIVHDGFGGELILYELASRVDPQATLRVDETSRFRLVEYVLKYVLFRKETAPPEPQEERPTTHEVRRATRPEGAEG